MEQPSQRRNENSSSSFFAVSMSRVPALDRDDFLEIYTLPTMLFLQRLIGFYC